MSRPDNPEQLDIQSWDTIQTPVDRFKQAWQKGIPVALDSFLPPPGDPKRTGVLRELVGADLEMRWGRSLGILLEAYLERFPELGPASALPALLILEEYRVRQRHGDQPSLQTYQERFPKQFPELQQAVLEASTHLSPSPSAAETPLSGTRPVVPKTAAGITPKGSLYLREGDILPAGDGYRLVRLLGGGSFADVWQAESSDGFPKALKIIRSPLEQEDARREQQALERIKKLSHPFLLATHSAHLVADRLVIVMELAEGTLAERLRACQAQAGSEAAGLPVAELLGYFREAAEAIDYMHSKHVLHRDIKPQNLMLHQGHCKVGDFGVSRLQENQRLVASASLAGTPIYMAPEMWQQKVGPPSDQYSLAITYVELRLGRCPFPCQSMAELMLAHHSGSIPLDPLPEAEQTVLHRALAPDPARRIPAVATSSAPWKGPSLLPRWTRTRKRRIAGSRRDGSPYFW